MSEKRRHETDNEGIEYKTRPDTRQSSCGRLSRSSNAKTARNSKMWPTDRPTDLLTDTAGWRVACPQRKKWWWENPLKSPWQCLCLTAYKEVVFQGIDIKSVMVWKILKRSFKWDQSGISSFIRSKVMSKTSEIMKMEEKFNDLENGPKSP